MNATCATTDGQNHAGMDRVEDRLHRVMRAHLDPELGTPFWLERATQRGIASPDDIRTLADLARLGPMTTADLAVRPLRDYIPRRFHPRLSGFIMGQTGGTTGAGTWTAYREDEFTEAFIAPFLMAAHHLGFPRGENWLFVGPSGPHIIGKVVRHLALAMNSADPFSVDFDPRWAKKLPAGSFSQQRYLQHVLDQAMQVMRTQDVGVLFTTPIVLRHLATAMTDRQRERIRGVHYGGTALSPVDLLQFQRELFPSALHLSGYGNTLCGCCLELSTRPGRDLDYFPHGRRLIFEVRGADGRPVPPGTEGQVCFTRLDESMLIVQLAERDAGILLPPPSDAPAGFELPGIRNPHPHENLEQPPAIGLY